MAQHERRAGGGVAFEVGAEPPRAKAPRRRSSQTAAAPEKSAAPGRSSALSSPPPLRRDGTIVLDKEASSGIALPTVEDVAALTTGDSTQEAPAAYLSARRQKLIQRGQRITLRLLSSWSAWTAGPLELGLTALAVLDSSGQAVPSSDIGTLLAGEPDEELHRRLLDGVGRTTDPSDMWRGASARRPRGPCFASSAFSSAWGPFLPSLLTSACNHTCAKQENWQCQRQRTGQTMRPRSRRSLR